MVMIPGDDNREQWNCEECDTTYNKREEWDKHRSEEHAEEREPVEETI